MKNSQIGRVLSAKECWAGVVRGLSFLALWREWVCYTSALLLVLYCMWCPR